MELADILSEESVLVCTGIKTKHDVLAKLSETVAAVTGHQRPTSSKPSMTASRSARPGWAMASPCRMASSRR